MSLADVIAVEGPREPPAGADATSVDVFVLVLEAAHAPLGVDNCRSLSATLGERFADFGLRTAHRVALRDVLDDGMTCESLDATVVRRPAFASDSQSASPRDAGCSLARGSRPRVGEWLLLGVGLGVRRRRSVTRR